MSTKDALIIGLIYESMLEEAMGSADVVGNSGAEYGGAIENGDTYATGDTRIPKSIFGTTQTRKGSTKKKCKCKGTSPCKCKTYDEDEEQCTKATKKSSSDRKGKKWTKCATQPDGSVKRIHWGQAGVKVTGDSGNTKRKKSFRARHNCSNAKKGSAQEAACKDW